MTDWSSRYDFSSTELLHEDKSTACRVVTCVDTQSGDRKRVAKIYDGETLKRVKEYRNTGGSMKSRCLYDNVLEELSILKMIDHPNCMQLLDSRVGSETTLIFPHFPIPSIMTPSGRLTYSPGMADLDTDPTLLRIYSDMRSALEYLHSLQIVHRDVKPDNIVSTGSGRFILSDFGSARRVENEYVSESPATVGFFPPEVCAPNAEKTYSGYKADIWALGMTLLCCKLGRLPYNLKSDSDVVDLLDAIAVWSYCETVRSLDKNESPEVSEILGKLLERDPLGRTL